MESSRRKLQSNPRETANILTRWLFTWTMPTFREGYKRVLEQNDMYEPLTCDRSGPLGDRLEKIWLERRTKSLNPTLFGTVFRTFWREYLEYGVLCLFYDVFIRIGQPILLGKLLQYFRADSRTTYEDALIYATGIVLLTAVHAILVNQYLVIGYHIGMKVRVAICSIVYRKALKLSHTALGETAPGKVINLLSNDVKRLDLLSMLINTMWTSPMLATIVGILLWYEIGWAGVIGILVICVIVPLQSFTGKLSSIFRSRTALRTDERVRFMDEIISGVHVIKMYAWEVPFSKLLALARRKELDVVRKSNYLRALYMTFILFTTRVAIFATMLSMVLLYGTEQITADKIFMIYSYFNVVSYAMTQTFVRGVAEIAEALVSFKRIQNFLESDEKVVGAITGTDTSAVSSAQIELTELGDTSVSLRNATARWTLPSSDKCPLTLNSLTATLEKGKLIGVIGSVGAGKSSLLHAILRELPLESGSIQVNGTISYASQEPWIFAGSVRQNILFGQGYDKERYDAVIKACALVTDFEQLPDGDRTIIGERGASLSGGQRARVNLARATYRQSDIYLLDDPLSAVDSHVGAHIFNKCLGPKGRLAQLKTTRILVTHQVHFLKGADWVIMLQDGEIAVQGTPSELLNSGIDFAALVSRSDSESNDRSDRNAHSAAQSMSRTQSTFSMKSGSDATLYGIEDDEKQCEEVTGVELEASSKGKVKGSKLVNYFVAGAHWSVLTLLLLSFLLTQIIVSVADIWISIWTKYEEQRKLHQSNEELLESGSNGTASFLRFLSFDLTTDFCVYVHGALMLLLFTVGLSRSIGLYSVAIQASQRLHDGMFKGLISTRMRFFDTNPSGRIFNRFSKDVGSIDENLPKALLDTTQIILCVLGSIAVIAYVNPLFLVPVILMSVVFAFTRRAYLKTSKSIKRLEAIAKSPILTHLAATMNGLPTIRSYNTQAILKEEFDYHLDTHTSCWFMFISTSSAFGLTLDVMCFIFVCCVIYFYMLFNDSASDAQIGLAITQALSVAGMLQMGIRQSAEVSNRLMSVERILEYDGLTPEPEPMQPQVVAENWPANGSITFKNVVYRYFAEAEPVLRDLSIVIQAKEKVGIVGRTGAGKSSLIGALFRLACIEGEITIDGVDTSTISLQKLRSSIAIIPQDPVLFSGTLRRNLDPFEEYSDNDIWRALEKVELKDIVSEKLGLSSAVLAHGFNFSVGQRQLMCLARAILRKNRVLVLDEATANVDPKTDLLIQETIRDNFADCTVLTIAHRLHTIIDSDRILVMDAGQAIEFDEAHTLLQNNASIFSGMVRKLGSQELRRLSGIALNKYNGHHEASHQF